MDPQAPATSDLQTRKYPFTLQEGEQVIKVTRRHWLYVWPKLALMLVGGIIPIVLLWLILGWLGVRDDDIGRWVGIGLSVLWGGYWLVNIYLTKYSYDHDMWVITDQRIIDVRKPNPLRLQMSSADMGDVLDMSVERGGIFGTAFNFGSVRCQTAGSTPSFVLSGVPDPAGVQALIDKTRDTARGTAGRRYNQPQYDAPPPQQYAPPPQQPQTAPPPDYAPPTQQPEAPPPQYSAMQQGEVDLSADDTPPAQPPQSTRGTRPRPPTAS